MQLEYKRDVWDKVQKKLINPVIVTKRGKKHWYVALDIRGMSKYKTLEAVARLMETLNAKS